MNAIISAAVVFSLVIVVPASAMTLEELDAQLRVLEGRVNAAGVTAELTEPMIRPPDPVITTLVEEVCVRDGKDMRAEKESLEELLKRKRDVVEQLNQRVSEMRRRLLLQEGCNDSEKQRLADLTQEIVGVTVDEERKRADALLDCVNQKIVDSERERTEARQHGAENYGIIGFNQRLDKLNDFSRVMLDLSIKMSSAADLRDRLEQSCDAFDKLIEQCSW